MANYMVISGVSSSGLKLYSDDTLYALCPPPLQNSEKNKRLLAIRKNCIIVIVEKTFRRNFYPPHPLASSTERLYHGNDRYLRKLLDQQHNTD